MRGNCNLSLDLLDQGSLGIALQRPSICLLVESETKSPQHCFCLGIGAAQQVGKLARGPVASQNQGGELIRPEAALGPLAIVFYCLSARPDSFFENFNDEVCECPHTTGHRNMFEDIPSDFEAGDNSWPIGWWRVPPAGLDHQVWTQRIPIDDPCVCCPHEVLKGHCPLVMDPEDRALTVIDEHELTPVKAREGAGCEALLVSALEEGNTPRGGKVGWYSPSRGGRQLELLSRSTHRLRNAGPGCER